MFHDLHLSALPDSRPASVDVSQVTQYLVNLCFEELVSATSNTKFPGTQVVALERKDLPLVHGLRPCHAPYQNSELDSWLVPKAVTIPALRFAQRWHAAEASVAAQRLDFGDEDGFLIIENMPLLKQLDFEIP